MKTTRLSLLVLTIALLCGCKHYDYFLVQPAEYAQQIGKTPVTLRYAPLEYRLARYRSRIHMDVANPSDTPVSLVGDRSYVVDPNGLSHPVPGSMIGPQSFIPMALPPVPLVYRVYPSYPFPFYGFYGFHGPGWHSPFRYPFYDDWFWYGPPPPLPYSVEVITPYHWRWPKGQVNLHLGYEQGGKTFDHHFVFDRREAKKSAKSR